jgi:hypothetical protein
MALASNLRQHEPLFDVHPRTGINFEVFYSDSTLETFGRGGAGWFWWPRQRGSSPSGSATGPFATSYAAYRHAMNAPESIERLCATRLNAERITPPRPKQNELPMVGNHTRRFWNLSGTF